MNSTLRFARNGLALSRALVGTVHAQGKLDRTILPIPEPNYPRSTVLDARDAAPPPRFQITAPDGAPNVIMVLIDGMWPVSWNLARYPALTTSAPRE